MEAIMTSFLFGAAVGFIVGGWVIDLNIRAPAKVKTWLASFFKDKDAAPEPPAKKS